MADDVTKKAADDLEAELIHAMLTAGFLKSTRESSLVKTKIEEALMWLRQHKTQN